jgi:hypothetical protein
MLQPQLRNAELVAILRTDFQHLDDPPRIFGPISHNVADPPTDAELTAAFQVTDAGDLPNRSLYIITDSDSSNVWLIMADAVTPQWLYIKWAIAV